MLKINLRADATPLLAALHELTGRCLFLGVYVHSVFFCPQFGFTRAYKFFVTACKAWGWLCKMRCRFSRTPSKPY